MNTNANIFVHVIDDSKDMQELLRVLFEAKGYTAEFSSDGSEALAFLQAASRLPDVILLDLQMPTVDGREFLRERETSERLRDIPVVLMTGEEDRNADDLRDLVSAFLPKPISMKSVIDAVVGNMITAESREVRALHVDA